MSSLPAERESSQENISWPARIVRGFQRLSIDVGNMISFGMSHLPFSRSSNEHGTFLDTLYRPHQNQLQRPYNRNYKKNIQQKQQTAWRWPWQKPERPKRPERRKDVGRNTITVSNYWKTFPRFSTSSLNRKEKTFYWAEDPGRSNRRAGGEPVFL